MTYEVLEGSTWFGAPDRPAFAWTAYPVGDESIGGLVIAPTIGREARASRRALRLLGREAASRGFCVVRVDYDGTGDAAGSFEDPRRDLAWPASVEAAVELLRSCDAGPIGVVGMRLGAAIAGSAADRAELGLASLVLWDPCDSGRTYLRELSALEALRREGGTAGLEGAVVTAEHLFAPAAAEDLRNLSLLEVRRPLAERVLVLRRDDRPQSTRLERALGTDAVEWRTTAEQGALLGVDPLFATMPMRTIREICDWLAPGAREPAACKPFVGRTAVELAAEGATVRERIVAIGPRELFGIVTEPASPVEGAPLVVLPNVSNEDHTGPSRLWVELSRRWARHGLRCVRFDLTGLGESPETAAGPPRTIYEQTWLEDTAEVARALTAGQSEAVFVGMCTGAFCAVEAAMRVQARGVCALNPPIGIDFLHGVMKLDASSRRPVRRLAEFLKYAALHLRWVSAGAGRFLRYLVPSVFGADVLRATADSGAEVYVLATRDDLSPLPGRRVLERFFGRRLLAPKHYEVDFVEGLDHNLHDPEGRRRAIELLDRRVLEHFAPRTTDNDAEKEHP